jgi:AcrR family transcriptional regulator
MASKAYDERLERLLSTAARVFAAKGYHPTTMRDLSRATGMSLAGMYYYVEGKDELLGLIQERCFAQVVDGAEGALSRFTDPAERLQRFIRHHVTFFAEHMAEMKVLSHEAESLSRERQAAIGELKRRYVALLVRLLHEAGIARNERPDPKVAAYALFGMMNWIYTWYDPKGRVPPQALAEQFTELFLHGVNRSGASPAHPA